MTNPKTLKTIRDLKELFREAKEEQSFKIVTRTSTPTEYPKFNKEDYEHDIKILLDIIEDCSNAMDSMGVIRRRSLGETRGIFQKIDDKKALLKTVEKPNGK